MHAIRHRVGIKAPQDRIYETLSSKGGLSQFWMQTEGDPEVGGRLDFYLDNSEPVVAFQVIELSPPDRVRWLCLDGPAEWVGTSVEFELKGSEGETALLFTHADWQEPTEFMHHCSTKWATFLIGLRSGLEGGAFTAFPDDTLISSSMR
jgi:uncharacterized protein YndB with AHSA1/START domain